MLGYGMAVTAKLSREFYERFGDKIVDELVGLLNDMDATFKNELRDLNDHNAQRFELKLEQFESRFDGKLDQMELRVDKRLAELKADLIKWMLLFWLGTVATMLSFGRFFLTG